MEKAKAILDKMASPDLYARHDFCVGKSAGCIIAPVNLADMTTLMELLKSLKKADCKSVDYDALIDILPNHEAKTTYSEETAIDMLLGGDAVAVLDGQEGYLTLAVRKYTTRAVTEPPTTGIIKGPREGFVEDMRTNMSLLQRRLRTPDLKTEKLTVGTRTGTAVTMVYIQGIADKKVVEVVYNKLRAINVDGVLDTHYIQEYLDERPNSVFAQSGISEKPDIVTAKLLEGRVAILVDGSPMVATVPFIFWEEVQSGEDYYERQSFTTMLRIVRTLALIAGVFLPGFYVAFLEFHFDILPFSLLLTIENATAGVPFEPFGEILFVLFLFEIIREAGIRMPQALGLAMSVVGALVLGDTAVKAGFIGSTAVMIVALSAISLYTVPNSVGSASLLRLLFTVIGGLLGMFGLMIGIMFLAVYMCSLEVLGTPYLAPFAPTIKKDLKDGIRRVAFTEMTTRPLSIPQENPVRQVHNGQD